MKDFKQYNESRRSKKRRFQGIERQYNRYKNIIDSTPSERTENGGMPLEVSPRFIAAVRKMSEVGGSIVKKLLDEIENKNNLYNISYIDLSRNLDMLTYLPLSEKDSKIDPYKNQKRIGSKIYKVIRMIFGNEVTKNEIQKFVSVFKNVCSCVPTTRPKTKTENRKQTDKEIVDTLIKNTVENKISWKNNQKTENLESYVAVYEITDNKELEFNLYIFPKEEHISNMAISYRVNTTKILKRDFIKNINFGGAGLLSEFNDLKELVK